MKRLAFPLCQLFFLLVGLCYMQAVPTGGVITNSTTAELLVQFVSVKDTTGCSDNITVPAGNKGSFALDSKNNCYFPVIRIKKGNNNWINKYISQVTLEVSQKDDKLSMQYRFTYSATAGQPYVYVGLANKTDKTLYVVPLKYSGQLGETGNERPVAALSDLAFLVSPTASVKDVAFRASDESRWIYKSFTGSLLVDITANGDNDFMVDCFMPVN